MAALLRAPARRPDLPDAVDAAPAGSWLQHAEKQPGRHAVSGASDARHDVPAGAAAAVPVWHDARQMALRPARDKPGRQKADLCGGPGAHGVPVLVRDPAESAGFPPVPPVCQLYRRAAGEGASVGGRLQADHPRSRRMALCGGSCVCCAADRGRRAARTAAGRPGLPRGADCCAVCGELQHDPASVRGL